ncbi:zinc-binding dehydrogenase [Kribbella turkmenica]|uniref:zinc-binding dehydrogenase n=1 Tax=Kribbella turkmenica TaxID=2530375 RepID=UPI0038992C63
MCHASLRCPPLAGRTITVVGDGTARLLAAQVARALGAAAVQVLGLDEKRLAFAQKLAADDVHQVGDGTGDNAPPADVVVECAGAPGTARLAIDCARRGGTVAILGVKGGDAALDVASDRFVVDDSSRARWRCLTSDPTPANKASTCVCTLTTSDTFPLVDRLDVGAGADQWS